MCTRFTIQVYRRRKIDFIYTGRCCRLAFVRSRISFQRHVIDLSKELSLPHAVFHRSLCLLSLLARQYSLTQLI